MTKASDYMHDVLKDSGEDTISSGTAFAGGTAGVAPAVPPKASATNTVLAVFTVLLPRR